jgi:glycosyltransferase involved in cell wall biosynthesis
MHKWKQDRFCIGIVLPYLKSRGTEKQALRLIRGFVGKGARAVVFIVQGWGLKSMYEALAEASAQVVNVGPPMHEGEKKVSFSRVFALAGHIRKSGCHVLLSRAGMTNKIAGYAGRLAFVPVAVTLSGLVAKARPPRTFRRRLDLSLRAAASMGFPKRIVAVSKEGAANFAAFRPFLAKRVLAIRNGVDASEMAAFSLAPDKNKFTLCCSGSLEIRRKGLDVLIRAIRILIHEHGQRQVSLVLIGVGDDEQKLRALVQEFELGENVVFAGEQAQPYGMMAQCSAFVLPSRWEGLPNALLEAMAMGLCSIAADCDTGPREIITHEETGLLVPVNNEKALSEAILRIIKDDGLRERLARSGKEHVRNLFTKQAMVDEYYEMLNSMSKGR